MPKTKDSAASGKKPARIHDKFFKDVFREIRYVISLIRAGAPGALFEIVDWSTLKLEPQSIQVSGQEERIADLVYSAALAGSKRATRIVLLFEHKSTRRGALEMQMARNQFLMYMQDEFQSLIVPIVVSQELSPESRPVEFISLFSDVPLHCRRVLTEYSVNFRCLLINVNEIERQGLAEGTGIDAVIRAMSTVRNFVVSDLQDLANRVRHVPAEDRERMFKLVFGYVCGYNDSITIEDIQGLETKTPEEQQMVHSAVEAFREEGRQEGREEVAVNLLHKGMGPEDVVEVTKLSPEKIETLRQKMNGASGD